MNVLEVVKIFEKHPKLETFIGAGTISLKMAREILDVDRHYMYHMYTKLVEFGAITPTGSNCFRATHELHDLLQDRRKHNDI